MVVDMESTIYTLKEVSRRISASLRDKDLRFVDRQIKHWTSNDLLKTAGEKHTGTGRSRLYTKEEIIVAAYLHRLTSHGVTIGNLKRFRKNYDSWMKSPQYRDTLLGKTNKHGQGGRIIYYAPEDLQNSMSGFAIETPGPLSDDVFEINDSKTGKVHRFESAAIIDCKSIVARLYHP
jgi:DNA-binding transcriptional MerR regulator